MKYNLKKISKRNKWILFVSTILVIGVSTFFLLQDKGESYTLPPYSEPQKNSSRRINHYLGNEFEWFLYTPDKVAMYVKEAGEGDTIVTLHGGYGLTHDIMEEFMKPFEENYHIVYYDQRGSTRSLVPENDLEKFITVDNMVNDLELLRRALKVDKLRLVAHSMGAILAYEYMRKFPENVGNVVIISGHPPKLPETNAEFYDAYKGRNDKDAFAEKQNEQMAPKLDKLKESMDTTSAEFIFLRWKMQSVALQVYDVNKWPTTVNTFGLYNGKINKLINPEVNIPLTHMWTFYITKKQFDNGTLDTTVQTSYKTPVNFLPEIENHKGRIDYILGTHDVADWNLSLQKRYLKETDRIKMHIYQNAGHNIWTDIPQKFHNKLSEILKKGS